jgi:hypothetical protein
MGCFEIAACCVSQFTMAARLAQSVGMTCTLIGIRSVRGAAQPARAAAAKSAKNIRITTVPHVWHVWDVVGSRSWDVLHGHETAGRDQTVRDVCVVGAVQLQMKLVS